MTWLFVVVVVHTRVWLLLFLKISTTCNTGIQTESSVIDLSRGPTGPPAHQPVRCDVHMAEFSHGDIKFKAYLVFQLSHDAMHFDGRNLATEC